VTNLCIKDTSISRHRRTFNVETSQQRFSFEHWWFATLWEISPFF